MEQADLVTRKPDPEDARLVRLHLTPRGRAVRRSVSADRAALEQHATATLTPAERDHLRTALTKIIAQLPLAARGEPDSRGCRSLAGPL